MSAQGCLLGTCRPRIYNLTIVSRYLRSASLNVPTSIFPPLFSQVNENDGVFQLTTIGSLPLKSPKRMVALQLANSNPAFRCGVFFFSL